MNRQFHQQQQQQQQDEEEDEANLSPSQLLQLAETHLRLRNFSLCQQYALESQQPNDPNSLSNHRYASQLLAVSNILSSPTNYYSILQVDTFCNDITLIRSKFKHLFSILDPIKENSNLNKEALNLVWKAYDCLSDPSKKTHFDAQISGQNPGFDVEGDEVGGFWTFCPYCFYMYQYARVYEGCCLRCQNESCRRVFHGVAVNSLPKAELDKGEYFSCFGYFPLGFNPNLENGKKGSRFESWSPIVGMFPVTNLGKNDTDFIEIVDESDESENDQFGGKGMNFGGNVVGGNAGNPRLKRRKSVALNARKLMGRGRRDGNEGGVGGSGDYEDGDDGDEECGVEGDHGGGGVGDVSGFKAEDMAFFEEGGEIFVEFGPDGGAL